MKLAQAARTVIVAVAIAATCGLLVLAVLRSGRTSPPPHIILIVVDTLRADAVGRNDTASPTPALERIASEGAFFRAATAQAPWTIPSVASILTSRYPSEHGQGTRHAPDGPEPTSLPMMLKAQGYRTAAFAELDTNFVRRGFDVFELPAGDHWVRYGKPEQNGVALTLGRAADWIREHANDGPLFVFIHTFEAHDYFAGKPMHRAFAAARNGDYRGALRDWAVRDPGGDLGNQIITRLLPASEEDARYLHDVYLGAVHTVDQQIGVFDDALTSLGLRDRTILAITSDHGEGFAPRLKRLHHGGRLHDDLLKVPLIVRWPRHIQAAVIRQRVQLVDLTPTLLRLSGQPIPAGLRGRSLFTEESGWSPYRVPSGFREQAALAEESSFRILPSGVREMSNVPQFALIAQGSKLIVSGSSSELYDLDTDPGEERNLAAARPQVVEAMRLELGRSFVALHQQREKTDAELIQVLRSIGYLK